MSSSSSILSSPNFLSLPLLHLRASSSCSGEQLHLLHALPLLAAVRTLTALSANRHRGPPADLVVVPLPSCVRELLDRADKLLSRCMAYEDGLEAPMASPKPNRMRKSKSAIATTASTSTMAAATTSTPGITARRAPPPAPTPPPTPSPPPPPPATFPPRPPSPRRRVKHLAARRREHHQQWGGESITSSEERESITGRRQQRE
nr:unnamed protein product [Digitaria exilis]